MATSPGALQPPGAGRGGKDPPLGLGKERGPTTPGSHTSGPRTGSRWLRVCHFVPAAQEGEGSDSRLGSVGTSWSPGPTGHTTWVAPAPTSHGLCFSDWSGAGSLPGSAPTHMRLSLVLLRYVRGACGAYHCPRPWGRVCEQSRQWLQSCWQRGGWGSGLGGLSGPLSGAGVCLFVRLCLSGQACPCVPWRPR